MVKQPRAILLFSVLLALSLGVFSSVVWAQSEAVISSAKSKLIICYDAALRAEAAGANITTLAATLNEAGLLLSQAEFAFSTGNFSGAQDYAVRSQSRLANFLSDANALEMVAEAESSQDFLINVIGSTVGTVAVLVGSFGVWHYLNRKYPSDGGQEAGSAAV